MLAVFSFTLAKVPDEAIWYTPKPMGVNHLASMMPRLSLEAALSHRYTDHSIRSTAVHLLNKAGLEA